MSTKMLCMVAAVMVTATHGAPLSEMVRVACQRNPSLKFCQQQAPPPERPPPRPVVQQQEAPAPAPRPAPVQRQAPLNWAATCVKYQSHFHYYCGNIEQQPAAEQQRLLKYCPLFAQHCPAHASDPNSQATWFPEVPTTTLAPCIWDCKEEHCTEKCKCDHHSHLQKDCHSKSSFPFNSNICQGFFKRCAPYGYKLDVEGHTNAIADHARSKGLPPPNPEDPHNRNHHAQFWRNPESHHTDWLHGGTKGGQDFGVPAFGIGGSVGNHNVAFPGPGQFLGIENPHKGPL